MVLASNLSDVEDSIKFLSTPERVPPRPSPSATVVQTAEAVGADETEPAQAQAQTALPPGNIELMRNVGLELDDEEGEGTSSGKSALWKSQLHVSWREEIEKMPEHKRQYFMARMPAALQQEDHAHKQEQLLQQSQQSDSNDLSDSGGDSPVQERRSLRRKLSSSIVNLRRSRNGANDSAEMFPLDSAEASAEHDGQPKPGQGGGCEAEAPRGSERGLLNFERTNNPLLVALRERTDLRDLTQFAEDIKATIAAPISTEDLAKHSMTRPFVQTHMFTLHGKPSGLSSRFITLNGLEGTLDLGTNEITLQTHAHKGAPPCQQKVMILRRGTCELHSGKLPLILLSEPLEPTRCDVDPLDSKEEARLSRSYDVDSPLAQSAAGIAQTSSVKKLHRRAASVDLDSGGRGRGAGAPPTAPVVRKSVLVARASKPVRPDSLMLSPSEEVVRAGRLPHNAPITVQLAHPSARQISQQIDSFITWFAKRKAKSKQTTDDGAGDVVSAFLDRVQESMQLHPMWAALSPFELRKARDDLQHHIFTRLYKHVFRTEVSERRDEHLHSKISKLATFIKPEHLEIDSRYVNEELWERARAELASINNFISPSEKLMCILNCCRIIIYSLQEAKSAAGADDFIPQLVYTMIRANPPSLHSNISYISRFCDSDVLIMENLCFYTHLVFCASFIEMLQASSLKIDPEEFRKHMGSRAK